jgi:YD repeat-containing protein
MTDRDRLLRATWSDGIVRNACDERGKLIEIRSQGRIIRNWFDDTGRWVVRCSRTRNPTPIHTSRLPAVIEDGSVVESADDGDV